MILTDWKKMRSLFLQDLCKKVDGLMIPTAKSLLSKLEKCERRSRTFTA